VSGAPLRVAFAGTPPFAATALEAIRASGHEVVLVLTQPDRPAGRGMRLTASAVSGSATRGSIPVLKPASLRDDSIRQALREANLDAMVVAAYGLLLPQAVLDIPRNGCINIHASLLPRWRGAAPIQRAILAGDRQTGVSIMKMDAGLDTGPVLLAEPVDIGATDTTGTLTDALAEAGARLIVEALDALDTLRSVPQDPALATLAPKIAKAEAVIDWAQPYDAIERQVRAFNPAPGAETRLGGETVKIWETAPSSLSGVAGEILVCDSRSFVVACGRGAIELRRVQRAGGKPVLGPELARGLRLAAGARFGATTPAVR
jgi:methionyl-tRNA formyltransferase